jgi:hypothetical protein
MLVHERTLRLISSDGTVYDRAYIYADPQRDGTWAGRIEFISEDGAETQATDRETTQSHVEGVAYWATGLELTYFEGALRRALRSRVGTETPEARPSGASTAVNLSVVTADPEVPFRIMARRTLVPGARRYVHNGGVIVYEGSSGEDVVPKTYDFLVQFGSQNAAALLANKLWSELQGLGVALEIEGASVPVHHAAIKDALLGALV